MLEPSSLSFCCLSYTQSASTMRCMPSQHLPTEKASNMCIHRRKFGSAHILHDTVLIVNFILYAIVMILFSDSRSCLAADRSFLRSSSRCNLILTSSSSLLLSFLFSTFDLSWLAKVATVREACIYVTTRVADFSAWQCARPIFLRSPCGQDGRHCRGESESLELVAGAEGFQQVHSGWEGGLLADVENRPARKMALKP